MSLDYFSVMTALGGNDQYFDAFDRFMYGSYGIGAFQLLSVNDFSGAYNYWLFSLGMPAAIPNRPWDLPATDPRPGGGEPMTPDAPTDEEAAAMAGNSYSPYGDLIQGGLLLGCLSLAGGVISKFSKRRKRK